MNILEEYTDASGQSRIVIDTHRGRIVLSAGELEDLIIEAQASLLRARDLEQSFDLQIAQREAAAE